MLYPAYGDDFYEVLWGTVRADGVSAQVRFVDLALRGCSIETQMSLAVRSYVRLMIAVPGVRGPIVVDRGVVRCVEEGRVGIEFVRMKATDRALYRRFVLRRFTAITSYAHA